MLDTSLLKVIACPKCHGKLVPDGASLRCESCGGLFQVEGKIPILISKPEAIEGFDYLKHYELDAAQFDYFEERTGATAHSERRLREFILSCIPKNTESILDVGCGSAWIAKAFQNSNTFVCLLD